MSDAMNPFAKQEAGTHYKDMPIQPVEFCQRNGLGFCESSVIKYVCRHRRKNKAEDLRKAIHFLELLMELEYGSKSTLPTLADVQGVYADALNNAEIRSRFTSETGKYPPASGCGCSDCAAIIPAFTDWLRANSNQIQTPTGRGVVI